MKKSILVLVILLIGCYSKDDDYYIRQVEIKDSFVFENERTYVVEDTIYFELNFSRYLFEEGYSNLLDIYETTGSEEFSYSFRFSKFSDFSNSYLPINIAEDFVFAEKGKVSGQSNEVRAVLNDEQTMYESRIGIKLAETGNFNFDTENYSFNIYPNNVVKDKIFFEVSHRFTDIDKERFVFTVTD